MDALARRARIDARDERTWLQALTRAPACTNCTVRIPRATKSAIATVFRTMLKGRYAIMSASEDELAPFVLTDVEGLDRGETAGHGAYGVVSEVKVKGIPCVAKKLHSILVGLEVLSEQRKAIQKKFRQECILLSKLRHPNIVYFIGVSYGRHPGDLTLIMERVETDLDKLLGSVPAAPLSIKLSLLCDVSYGLLYLHTSVPPILHRDLTPRNVLITKDMRAKLADLGGSKQLVNLYAAGSLAPGATNYMPPEALTYGERHNEKLDVFSFGNLTLFTVNQKEPYINNHISLDWHSCGSVEIAKRQKDIDTAGKDHCLYQLIIHCLQDSPEKRPSTQHVNSTLIELCLSNPRSADDLFRMCGGSSEVSWKYKCLAIYIAFMVLLFTNRNMIFPHS